MGADLSKEPKQGLPGLRCQGLQSRKLHGSQVLKVACQPEERFDLSQRPIGRVEELPILAATLPSAPLGDVERYGERRTTKLVHEVAVATRYAIEELGGRSQEGDCGSIDVQTLKTEHAGLSARQATRLLDFD